MNNNKNGVTIVALTMIIITMSILLSIVGLNINNVIKETQVKGFASELQQLEYLINDYKTRNSGNVYFNEYIIDTTAIPSDFLAQMSEETIVGNNITLYEIDYYKIDAMDTNYGKQENGSDDIYLYSLATGKVYYKLGFEYNSEKYYTLTNYLKEILGN